MKSWYPSEGSNMQCIKRTSFFLFLFIVGVFLLPSTSDAARAKFQPKDFIPYKTYLFNLTDSELKKTLLERSKLVQEQGSPPETVEILKKRAQDDLENLQKVLAEEGYYDAQLDFFVDDRTDPTRVYLKVDLGPLYKIGAFKLKSDPPNVTLVDIIANDISKVGIHLGAPAKKKLVQKATAESVNYLRRYGYPFAKLKSDRVVIDRSKKEMQIALLLHPGGMARFGNTVLQENGGVTADFIKARMRWNRGDTYNEEKVLETMQSLHNTSLFKEVKVTHDDRVDAGGFITMYLKLVAADKHTIRPIASYTPGLSLEPGISWEARNFSNRGDILKTGVIIGKERKYGALSYIIPDFKTLNLNLRNELNVHSYTLTPYTTSGFSLSSIADYPFTEKITGAGGIGFDSNNLTNPSHTRKKYRYLKGIFKGKFSSIAGEDSPRDGVRVSLELLPHLQVLNRSSFFFQSTAKPEFFFALDPKKDLIFHGWASISASPGAGRSVIPAHKLFYNTIRGYKFQMAGTLQNKIPVGARSALSFGGELEYYFSDLFSILSFIDLGTAYDRQFPDFKNALLYGVGGGLRYRVPWGTLRLDVASPIKRRSADSSVEFYAGLDQSL